MAADYKVTITQPWTYLDSTGKVVEGFKVWFELPQFNETHSIFVPNLNPDLVKNAITNLVNQRKNLATL